MINAKDDFKGYLAHNKVDDGPQKSIAAFCNQWSDTIPAQPFLIRPTTTVEVTDGTEGGLLEATARLGLPLYYRTVGEQPELSASQSENFKRAQEDNTLVDSPYNRVLYLLSTSTSPGSAETKHIQAAKVILLSRVDGELLTDFQVKLMWMLIGSELNNPGTRPIIHQRLTPDNFIKFWNNVDTTIECPVSLACGACGKTETGMNRCGECGVVAYCSFDCQMSHFDTHKKVCVKK